MQAEAAWVQAEGRTEADVSGSRRAYADRCPEDCVKLSRLLLFADIIERTIASQSIVLGANMHSRMHGCGTGKGGT